MEEIKFEIDLDALEIDDLEVLDRSKPETTMHDLLNVLDRLVIGGVRGHGYKVKTLDIIAETIKDLVEAQANPVDANGKN